MAITTSAEFIEALLRYRLLDKTQLEQINRAAEPRAIAKDLLTRGWLTPFQANSLFQERGAELLLGEYVLLERLGEGGMGQVFKARHRLMNRIVALKVIRKELLTNGAAVDRFHREIRMAAQLDHPHLVRAHDAAQVGDTHFLVMEYAEGTDLHKLVQKSGPLPVARACAYIRQAALGLQHALERGMIHRDIKPSNLQVTAAGTTIKILDMGLARSQDSREGSGELTQARTIVGTPDYIAPEQIADARRVDIRADIYSLGCTLYFLLAGRPPFPDGAWDEKLACHRQAEPRPIEQFRADVPAAVAAVLRKMTAKRPEDRYQTPAAVAEALTQHAGLAGSAPAGSAATRPAPTEAYTRPAGSQESPSAVGVKTAPLSPSVNAVPTPSQQGQRAVLLAEPTVLGAAPARASAPNNAAHTPGQPPNSSLPEPTILLSRRPKWLIPAAAGAGSGLLIMLLIILWPRGGGTDKNGAGTPAPPPQPGVPRPIDAGGIRPPTLPADKVVRTLPGIAEDIRLGGGGRYFVLQLPKMKKLAIFDVSEASIVRYIPLGEDKVIYAAGLDKVVVGLCTKGILERWDLSTGQKEQTLALPFAGEIQSVLMGSAAQNHVVVNGIFFDLQTLKQLPVKTPKGIPPPFSPVSADGTVFGGWNPNFIPGESSSFVLQGDELRRYNEGLLGHVAPGPDGRAVYTAYSARTNQLRELSGAPANPGYCVPAVEGNFYLALSPADAGGGGSLAIYVLGQEGPLVRNAGIAHGLQFDNQDRTAFGPWKRIFFIPSAKVIIILPDGNDRLELYRFDVDQALEASGVDYLLVSSQPLPSVKRGAEFSYQLVVKSKKGGVQYRLGSGPPGMEVSPAGLVRWRVPVQFMGNEQDVILSVRDASGQEVFHTFTLRLAR
jgi:serine/threonine protein kinase